MPTSWLDELYRDRDSAAEERDALQKELDTLKDAVRSALYYMVDNGYIAPVFRTLNTALPEIDRVDGGPGIGPTIDELDKIEKGFK